MIQDRYKSKRDISIGKIFFNQRTLAFFGLAILITISIPLVKNYNQKKMINKEIADMKAEIARVENKNNDLKKLIEYFESDQFTEEQARLNFGLKKGGEQVAVLKDSAPQTVQDGARNGKNQIFNIPGLENQPAPKMETNPKKWWGYFFHK